MSIEHLEPKPVFRFFAEISAIPRGSKNEQAISDYLVAFAKKRGLWVHQDEFLNVLIRKPASAGYENVPPVILQGHMDMVCVKDADVWHNFTTDGIKLVADGAFLRAEGTTLGADNGIAVAYCLAVLDDDTLSHPPIEALFTADEEEGMSGARNFNASLLSGRRLLNIDSDVEGEFLTSCAGGATVHMYLPLTYTSVPAGYIPCELCVSGLMGGHSGGEIHRELGNANRILSRALCALTDSGCYIADISGGAKENAIPRDARATLLIAEADCAAAEAQIAALAAILKSEYRVSDPGVSLTLSRAETMPGKAFAKETGRKLAMAASLLPNGIQHMCMDESLKGMVESSLNIGVVNASEDRVEYRCLIRSSVASRKDEMVQRVRLTAEALGADFKVSAEYPVWEHDPDSRLQPFFQREYERFTGKPALMRSIHAGLECGWFAETMDKPDMISLGPTNYSAHSPLERVEIASVGRVWDFLKHVLANLD